MFNLNDFRKNISNISEHVSEKNINDKVIFHYRIYPHIDGLWDNQYLRESRGITFNINTGKLISLPFHKFFNIGEVKETQKSILFSECSEYVVFDKIDGSLIIVELDNDGKLVCRTKRSYDNEQAKLANYILKNKSKQFKDYLKYCIMKGYTPMFELVTDIPSMRIVVKYDESDFYFLCLRYNKTGEYIIEDLPRFDDVKYPSLLYFYDTISLEKYLDELENNKNIEGVVGLCLDNGVFFKYKIDWYLSRHRAKDILKAPKSFIELFIDGKLDDIYSLLSDDDKKIAKQLETICFQRYNAIINDISKIIDKDKLLDRKEFALKYSKLPFFGLLIREYSGQTYDMKKYFMKHEYPIIKEKFDEYLRDNLYYEN